MCKNSRKYRNMTKVPEGLQKQFKFYFYNQHLLTRSIAKDLLGTKEHKDKRGWDKIGLTTAELNFWKNLNTETLPFEAKKTNKETNPIETLSEEKFLVSEGEEVVDEITN